MDIELKKWSFECKEALVQICNDVDRKYLSDRMPFPYTDSDAVQWLNMVSASDGKDGVFRAVWVDGRIVGSVSVEIRYANGDDAIIGYFLVPDSCRKGIMTRAVSRICDIAFSELDIVRITGMVYEPNIASRRVLEKNGFVVEDIMKNAVRKNEEIYNICIYGKIK